MKNKITRYTIIQRDNIKDLEDAVEAYIIRGGWEPQGGVTVKGDKDNLIQAMIFREKE
jgi:hypothetical protein